MIFNGHEVLDIEEHNQHIMKTVLQEETPFGDNKK